MTPYHMLCVYHNIYEIKSSSTKSLKHEPYRFCDFVSGGEGADGRTIFHLHPA
jgi:hypothetical protein